jgi:chemotaxis methyl-accepting protein methylase
VTPVEEIAAIVRRECGIVLREPQFDALAGALERLDPGAHPVAVLARLRDPVAGPAVVGRLIDEVTVKETFFLREREQLDELSWGMLHGVARLRGDDTIRIWTAGCATGEEPYTVALMACEAFGSLTPPIAILATDVSGAALAAAREGSYRPRSTRDLPEGQRQRHFHQDGERLVVGDDLRRLVTFRRHNLVRDPVPPLGEPRFDLVLCRNVLIYFDPETARSLIARLEASLAPGGVLLLGAADALCRPARVPGEQKPRGEARVATRGGKKLRRPLGRPAPPPSPEVDDPLDAAAHFLRGLAEAEGGNSQGAIAAFRAALYAEPSFALAAFQLGCAYETVDDPEAARRAYRRSLAGIDSGTEVDHALLGQIPITDVKAAIQLRLATMDRR